MGRRSSPTSPGSAGTICEVGIAERRLIVNADDFGLSEGVTRGILDAHLAGSVTSASMFANTPGFEHATCAARSLDRLDVGLHFNLTVGSPLTPPNLVPSLCDGEGRFLPLAGLLRRAFSGRLDSAHVARECAAQLDRLRATGIAVTHVDGHRQAHVLPGVWRGVAEVARRAGVRVRVPTEPLRGGRPAAKLAVGLAWWIAAHGVTGPERVEHFRGIGLTGVTRFADRLLELLDRLPPGDTELMVHPGYTDADLLRLDSYGSDREVECVALRSPEVLSRLTRGDFRLVRFREL